MSQYCTHISFWYWYHFLTPRPNNTRQEKSKAATTTGQDIPSLGLPEKGIKRDELWCQIWQMGSRMNWISLLTCNIHFQGLWGVHSRALGSFLWLVLISFLHLYNCISFFFFMWIPFLLECSRPNLFFSFTFSRPWTIPGTGWPIKCDL